MSFYKYCEDFFFFPFKYLCVISEPGGCLWKVIRFARAGSRQKAGAYKQHRFERGLPGSLRRGRRHWAADRGSCVPREWRTRAGVGGAQPKAGTPGLQFQFKFSCAVWVWAGPFPLWVLVPLPV